MSPIAAVIDWLSRGRRIGSSLMLSLDPPARRYLPGVGSTRFIAPLFEKNTPSGMRILRR